MRGPMTPSLPRRRLLAGAALALAAPAIGRAAPVLNVSYVLRPFNVPQIVMRQRGLLEQRLRPLGYGVAWHDITSGVLQAQAMAAGSLDIGAVMNPVSVILALANGNPMRIIGGFARNSKLAAILAVNPAIRTVADLKGRTVGVSSLSSILSWMIGEIAVREGWQRDAIHQVASGPPTAQVALLKSGQLDAAGSDLAPALQLEASGDVRILARFGDIITQSLNNVIFATDGFIAARPDDLRAFLKGWFATIAYARAHRDQTVADMTTLLGIDRKFVEVIYDRQMPMYLDDGHFPKAGLALIARAIVEVHMLDAEPDMAKLYTEAYLPK